MTAFITRLETPRLALRKAGPDDLDAIWRNVWQDASIARYMLRKPTETREEALERLARTVEYQTNGHSFFVCLKDTDEPIGFAGVKEEAPGVYEDSGICVAVKCQNQGFGKEIVRALCKLVFEELAGDAFLYSCFHENVRSAAVCKALGFVYTHSEEDVRAWDGYPYTADYYELTKDDYIRNREVDFHA